MSTPTKVCIVGHAIVDVTFFGGKQDTKLRLGGIAHAARALWAMGIPYSLAYLAPTYLDSAVKEFADAHGCSEVQKIGNVTGAPNVVTIGEPTEAGAQGYEFLLRDVQRTLLDREALKNVVADSALTDFLIFPGGFDLRSVLETVRPARGAVHVDANFEPYKLDTLRALRRPIETLIFSTSSERFLLDQKGNVPRLIRAAAKYSDHVIFKENRGGSRLFRSKSLTRPIRIPAQNRNVLHSVGVGDCFDAIFVAGRKKFGIQAALAYASAIAAEYASTTYPDDFRAATVATLKIKPDAIVKLRGTSLPWESRPAKNIYIAGPAFNDIDCGPIKELVDCLRYHNFTPRLPIAENGHATHESSEAEKHKIAAADIRLLDECSLVVAVLLYNDPGTLIEIGIALEKRLPVLVFDPYNIAKNLILTSLPKLVSGSLNEIVSSVFASLAPAQAAS